MALGQNVDWRISSKFIVDKMGEKMIDNYDAVTEIFMMLLNFTIQLKRQQNPFEISKF